ncbi:hypothetical protein PVAP13_5KG413507 [Panicum virgatum]|uniref:Uncharacterized protein n=1 Tax=Panicum virgatum TaxID=38727 RepID=A0A8T0SQ11_PANVG|nr:hypothetical protein PVAP13_5KG413507 [Panicum virgatum]
MRPTRHTLLLFFPPPVSLSFSPDSCSPARCAAPSLSPPVSRLAAPPRPLSTSATTQRRRSDAAWRAAAWRTVHPSLAGHASLTPGEQGTKAERGSLRKHRRILAAAGRLSCFLRAPPPPLSSSSLKDAARGETARHQAPVDGLDSIRRGGAEALHAAGRWRIHELGVSEAGHAQGVWMMRRQASACGRVDAAAARPPSSCARRRRSARGGPARGRARAWSAAAPMAGTRRQRSGRRCTRPSSSAASSSAAPRSSGSRQRRASRRLGAAVLPSFPPSVSPWRPADGWGCVRPAVGSAPCQVVAHVRYDAGFGGKKSHPERSHMR